VDIADEKFLSRCYTNKQNKALDIVIDKSKHLPGVLLMLPSCMGLGGA